MVQNIVHQLYRPDVLTVFSFELMITYYNKNINLDCSRVSQCIMKSVFVLPCKGLISQNCMRIA
jgi:hypothetical protein